MIDLHNVLTIDLVNELSKRPGVERIDVEPHVQTVEIAVCENGQYPYDKIETGPFIILKVSD